MSNLWFIFFFNFCLIQHESRIVKYWYCIVKGCTLGDIIYFMICIVLFNKLLLLITFLLWLLLYNWPCLTTITSLGVSRCHRSNTLKVLLPIVLYFLLICDKITPVVGVRLISVSIQPVSGVLIILKDQFSYTL